MYHWWNFVSKKCISLTNSWKNGQIASTLQTEEQDIYDIVVQLNPDYIEDIEALETTGKETIEVQLPADVKPRQYVTVVAVDEAGSKTEFEALVRFDSEVDVDYYKHGGILQMVLRQKLA